MKPFKILLFFLSVYTLLLTISVFFPEDGINIGKQFKLKFFSVKDIFTSDTVEYADISKLTGEQAFLSDSVLALLARETDTIRANTDSLLSQIVSIEYPANNKEVLYPVFKAFKELNTEKKVIRIIHYGDSQLEGDRITSYIRYKLQNRFGGSGIGLVPVQQLYDYTFSINQKNSDNWHRYTVFGVRDTSLKHNRYGVLGSFFTFTPYVNDSIIVADTITKEAWVSFGSSSTSYSNTKTFQRCKVFYGNTVSPFTYEVYANNELIKTEQVENSEGFNFLQCYNGNPINHLKITFKGSQSPEIYGIALDGNYGVAVDNIAMRGCSGTIFTSMSKSLMKEMYDKLNVKLFLLQFGGNVVPNITDDYTYYENRFYKQLIRLKEVCPDAVILVIGVADMSIKEKNKYVTYPNLEKVRDALKNATFKAGGAYWDMYKAMGGRNSMPSWVYAQPPLAATDFVHFNPKGAKIISQMFYNALIFEYNQYENQLNKINQSENGK